MAQPYNLRPLRRFITGHDASGKAIFLSQVDSHLPLKDLEQMPLSGPSPSPGKVALAYTTTTFPVQLTSAADVSIYTQALHQPLGLSVKNGTVFRFLDIPPGARSPMHVTPSLDYGVVLEGVVKAGLDSGEEQVLERGDCVVQRATNHMWTNGSETEWARMLFVLCDAEVQ